MSVHHRMNLDSRSGQEMLFVCPHEGCGRRFVLSPAGGLVVIDRGDFFALHSGGTDGLEVSGEIAI
jgi:hypothetical protein